MEEQEWIRIFQMEIETLNRKEHTWHLEFDENIDPDNPNMGWKKYFKKTSARLELYCWLISSAKFWISKKL